MIEEGKEQIYKAALAGLLHDIGKFGQRAGEVGTDGKKDHPAVGDRFVSQHVPGKWRGALAPVGWHHVDPDTRRLPDLLPVRIVALADRLSAGERDQQEKEDRPQQMISIFSRIGLNGDTRNQRLSYLPLAKLELEKDALFPRPEADPSEKRIKRYQALWNDFCREADTIGESNTDLESYLESILHLLRRYTWAIPSAYYYAQPDVSLYEHLHTTAALSACFAKQWTDEAAHAVDSLLDAISGKSTNDWPDQPKVAGLLAGDISGIQSFIYGIHNPKKATAVLRARSFYIQMLSEAAARFILRRLDLPITNALYIGGGGFTLIVPPLEEEQVAELSREINRTLLRAHGGELYLGLGYVPMAPRDFGRGGVSRVYEKLSTKLDSKKARRFSELSTEELTHLFTPQGGEYEEICSICGREAQPGDLKGETEGEGETLRWCPSCVAFRGLGHKLRRANYLRISDVEPSPLGEGIHTWEDVFQAFGLAFAVGTNPPEPPSDARRSGLFGLTDKANPIPEGNTAVGRRFIVNIVPTNDSDTIKHFGILAQESKGASYLGILRMDMDNLGRIFSRSLGDNDSLSRRATLSFLLSAFFEGWVGRIATEMAGEDGRERLYSVYSGGDDLFFVGSWDATVELARRIRHDLKLFTSRPDLGISGGIVLVHEKYPLYIAAKDAEKAESSAKHLREGKDAFSFLNTPVPWEQFGANGEGDTVATWADALIELIRSETSQRAVLRVIQDLYFHYKSEKEARGPMGPWVWHAAYWFARAKERNERNKELVHRLEQLEALLTGEEFANNIEWLALAARWAELATRKEEKRAE